MLPQATALIQRNRGKERVNTGKALSHSSRLQLYYTYSHALLVLSSSSFFYSNIFGLVYERTCTGVCGSAAWSGALVCAYYYYYYGLVGGGQVGKFMGERGDSFLTNFFPSRTSKGTKGHDPGTRLEAWRELYHTHRAHEEREMRDERALMLTQLCCVHHPSADTKTGLSSLRQTFCALALLHADHTAAARLTLANDHRLPMILTMISSQRENKIAN